MAKYEDGCYGSAKGIALIGKVLAGRCKMHYTRVAVGKGKLPEDLSPKALEEPPEYVMDAMIASVTNPVDGECQVSAQINSAYVEKGFYATWLILYAEDPDEDEVPFTALCLENEPEWIRPSSSIVGKLAHFDLIAAVGDVDCVSATIDPDALVTAESVRQFIAEHNADPEAHKALLKRFLEAGEAGEPGSPPVLDENGKIPEAVLPDDVVRLGKNGKIDSSLLSDEVLQKETGVLSVILTIPAGAWTPDPDGPCAYRAAAPCGESTNAHIPYVSLDKPSMAAAENCGFYDKADAADGAIYFWAETPPAGDIIARAALLGPGGTGVSIKLGSGLKRDHDGAISVDAASEEEVQEMLAGVFPDNK